MKNAIKIQSKNYFLGLVQLILTIAFLTGAAQAATYTVTTTADSGSGSLRQAILNANASAGADTISFNIPGGGVQTIVPQSPGLPEIYDSVTINGTTQPGYVSNPLIVIDGSGVDHTKTYSGLLVRNGNVIVKALVIRDFPSHGIKVECSVNCNSNLPSLVLTGSRIGTNSDGTAAAGNGWSGVYINTNKAATSQIGGTGANERNVISGNGYSGIQIDNNFLDQLPDNNFLIINNMIGTNLAGTAALPNASGVSIKASRVTVGGDAPAERNVISGNNYTGIIIGSNEGSDDYNVIEGNYIGTNAAGTAALGNKHGGIEIYPSDNNRIGGLQPGTGNVISGNGWSGISFHPDAYYLPYPNGIVADGPNDTQIYGNKIGTNAAGTAAVGNGNHGISIIGNNNSVGLSGVAASSNIVSGNGENGVVVRDQRQWYGDKGPHHTKSKGNKIQLNYIGTNPAGADLGNGKDGVLVFGEVTDTLIGGGSVAENTIAFNDGNGVALSKNTSWNNTVPVDAQITGNKIHSNGGLGIKIYDAEIEGGDAQDADTGANNLQNFPVLNGAYADSIVGSLHSTPNTTFNLDFFSTPTCDDLGRGEGKTYLNSITVTTNVNGTASFQTNFSGVTGAAITATATAPPVLGNTYGSTSEFSQCVTQIAQPLTKVSFDSPSYFANESDASATITVTRTGGLTGSASVSYATSNATATAGPDYAATSGTLTFNPGQATKTFTIPIVNDTMDETNESVNIALSNPSPGAVLVNNTSAILKITDDDDQPTVSINDVSLAEGNENLTAFTFNITLSEAAGTQRAVSWATANGTATAASDYQSASGTVNFAAGETSKQITVQVYGETSVEVDETFQVNLSAPQLLTIGDGQGIGTIQDDDNQSSASISGIVNYAITPINQSQKTVPGVLVYATGPSNGAATSDSDGVYQINNLTAGGNYTVVASKTGDRNGISPFDATLVLKHVAANGQGPNVLSLNQQKAADTSGDGNITPFDATLILKYVAAGGPTANTGQTGNWKFLPGTQNYQSLDNSLSGENYEAVLIGEINGNWTPPAPGSLAPTDNQDEIAVAVEEAEAEISLPDNASAASGSIIVVPVAFANKSGKSISGYNFDVAFDPNVLQPDSATPIDTSATLSQEMTVVHNTAQTGRIGIAASGGNSNERIAKGDVLLKLRFRVVGTANDLKNPATALTFHHQPIIENESGEALTVKSANGSVRVSAGGAGKSVTTVSGQVTTAEGRGIRNVSVTLAGANGENRTVMTGAGGEYHFTDVQAGETYTISVSSKRFRFNSASQMRTIFAEAEEINFTALE